MSPDKHPEDCISTCQLGTALDGLSVGVVLTDQAGRIVWMNRAAADMLGCTGRNLTRTPLAGVLVDRAVAAFWKNARSCEQAVVGDVSMTTPSRRELTLHVAASLDERGKVQARVLLIYDSTRERTTTVELSRQLTRRLLDVVGTGPTDTHLQELSPRELDILRLVGAGHSNEQIAGTIDIAPATVRSHLKNIYRKLDVHSRYEAVRLAVRNNLS